MMMKQLYSAFVLLILILISCKKKDEDINPVPVIELISITPQTIMQFRDSVILTLKYKDEDGDLGAESPDEDVLEIKDSRLLNPDYYHIAPLSPLGKKLKVEGSIQVRLNNMFLLGNGTTEPATLTIKIKDRAGNWSNELITPAIMIKDSL